MFYLSNKLHSAFLLIRKLHFDHCLEWLCFSGHGNVGQVYTEQGKKLAFMMVKKKKKGVRELLVW